MDLTTQVAVSQREINTSVTGVHVILYAVEDAGGNIATATRTVTVVVDEDPESGNGLGKKGEM